jgi:hypothetical protein
VKINLEGEKNMSDSNNTAAPLAENEYVSQLFSILQENGRDTTGLFALLGHISQMEYIIKHTEDKITEMKSQLAELKDVQNHPVKTKLQTAIKRLESNVTKVREQLGELKNNIVLGCKNAVTAFQDKGIAALDKLTSFFHIKSGLQAMDKNVTQSIAACSKAVANINEFANQYHSANRALKNMGRMIVGKAPLDVKKEAGKLAKAVSAPYKAEKAALLSLQKAITATVKRLEQLETAAESQQTKHIPEKKPPILGELEANVQMLAKQDRERVVQERAKTKGVEL